MGEAKQRPVRQTLDQTGRKRVGAATLPAVHLVVDLSPLVKTPGLRPTGNKRAGRRSLVL